MKSRAEIVSFGLFLVVALAALFFVLRGRGESSLALALVLAAVIAVRGGMFLYNLKRQRDRLEGRTPAEGKPEPKIKLDL